MVLTEDARCFVEGRTMIIIINGAPGVGKSKTAELLHEQTQNSAWVDGDWLLRVNPLTGSDKERFLRYELIGTLAERYKKHGYETIVISFVYMGPNALAKQLEYLEKVDTVKVFSIVVNKEALTHRHTNDTYPREKLESSLEINEKIRNLEGTEIIDTSDLSLKEVVEVIKKKLE